MVELNSALARRLWLALTWLLAMLALAAVVDDADPVVKWLAVGAWAVSLVPAWLPRRRRRPKSTN